MCGREGRFRAILTTALLGAILVGAGCSSGGSTGDAGAGEGPSDGAPPAGRLVGYYAEWSKGVLPAADVPWGELTHVVEAFALPRADGGVSNAAAFGDGTLVSLAHAHGVKAVASVGGATGDFVDSVVDAAARAATVAALAALCGQGGYDGLDIDWEFPDTTTVPAWVAFMGDLRAALDAVRPGLTLSSTLSPTASVGDLLPVSTLSTLDWIGVMTYRYSTATSHAVGLLSPLADASDAGSMTGTIDHLIHDRGLPPGKLLLGLAFYGLEFEDGPPGTPITSPSRVVELDDSQILPLVGAPGWTRTWDAIASAPELTDGPLFITYEDTTSIDARCAFVHQRGLGGAMVWQMAQGVLGDGSQPLLNHAAGCR